MKVYRIQSTYYDIDGEYISLLDEVYISKKVAEKYKPEDYDFPHESCEYEIIEQEIIEN